jgi:SAM-dependent methyltransferase
MKINLTPFSEASERNKEPILRILEGAFRNCRTVLEIGSGTGQHAVHFARHLPHLAWQPTDLAEGLPDLEKRVELEGPENLLPPIELDVRAHPWPVEPVAGIFTANTLHIMDWRSVEHFFEGVGRVLKPAGVLCVYGPFRYRGAFTTASNADFDRYLKVRDPASGIRDFEAVDALARGIGLALTADHAMPANNQMLVWSSSGAVPPRR